MIEALGLLLPHLGTGCATRIKISRLPDQLGGRIVL